MATTAQPGDPASSSTQSYQVDLRKLELKAARLRAEAEKAEPEATQARLAGQVRRATGGKKPQ